MSDLHGAHLRELKARRESVLAALEAIAPLKGPVTAPQRPSSSMLDLDAEIGQ